MTTKKIDFTDVQSTMLITLFLRAAESKDPHPVLGDHFAQEAVERIEHDWTKIDKPSIIRNRFLVALRSQQFDNWTAEFLGRHPQATVLQLACGLDARAFRLSLHSGVRWFDVDLPDVIDLRRELYTDTERYRMIAASVTDPTWLDDIPADQPVLIIAEGLLMYLHEPEVAHLLQRLTDHFSTGELIFDGIAPWGTKITQLMKKHLSRWYPYPVYWTATRDGSDIERWNPRLHYRDHIALLTQHDKIPDPTVRRIYQIATQLTGLKNYLRLFRAEFGTQPRTEHTQQ